MNSNSIRYHLRFQIIPGEDVEQRSTELAEFCKKHDVEEVVLFYGAEEWNNGLLSQEEEDLWFGTVKTAKDILDKQDITVSLNPWFTVLHTSRGRGFPADKTYAPTVSPAGEVSTATASFADEAWRKGVCAEYGRFAELGFRVIWVEDDFRYHNHAPLTWGGGFEEEVLVRFRKKVNAEVTREEVVKNILKPGEPHPWRELWMENWREIQLEVAAMLRDEIARRSPGESALGLMSSSHISHSIEGRDWKKLFEALTIDGRLVHRPHYAGYSEMLGRDMTRSIMMLDLQKSFRPAGTEVAPEVENFPFTRWNKSDTQTWSEMALCMFSGADALLLDLFPFTGGSVCDEPEIGDLLDRSRSALQWISDRFTEADTQRGIGLPWKENAEALVHTAAGTSMGELNADNMTPGHLFLKYGVPVTTYRRDVNAVFGNMAWTYSDDEIRDLLGGGLLLDGESALILQERGFGEDIGVEIEKVVDREGDTYSIETTVSEECGVRTGMFFTSNNPDSMPVMKAAEDAQEWTAILRSDRSRFGAGMVVHENSHGGRIVTWAVSNPTMLAASRHRQIITQKAVEYACGGTSNFARVRGGEHLLPVHYEGESGTRVVVFNGSPDSARPVITLPASVEVKTCTLLPPLAEPVSVSVHAEKSGDETEIVPDCEIPYRGYLILEC